MKHFKNHTHSSSPQADIQYIPQNFTDASFENALLRNYTFTGSPQVNASLQRKMRGKATEELHQQNEIEQFSNVKNPVLNNEIREEKLRDSSSQQYFEREEDGQYEADDDMESKVESFYSSEQERAEKDKDLTGFQRKCYYFFEKPTSLWGKIFSIISNICILGIMILLCVNSLPSAYVQNWQSYRQIWLPIDIFIVIVFTIEYLGKMWASTDKLKFILTFWSLVDLVSLIPFYIELALPFTSVSEFRYLSLLRLFKTLKIFQPEKHSVGFNLTHRVFRRSAEQIFLVSFWVVVIILLSSLLLYYLERGDFDYEKGVWYRANFDGEIEKSPYQSILHSFWWSIVTLTTTGYGDAVPITLAGKVIAGLTMLCGILVIAIPTSIIGSNFVTEFALLRRMEFRVRLRESQKRAETLKHDYNVNKMQRIEILKDANQTMLEAMADIQERLMEINPPRYWEKYKLLQLDYHKAINRIVELEEKLAKMKRIAQNLNKFNNSLNPRRPRNYFPKGGLWSRSETPEISESGDDENSSFTTKKVNEALKRLHFQKSSNSNVNFDLPGNESIKELSNQDYLKLTTPKVRNPLRIITQIRKNLSFRRKNQKVGFHQSPNITSESGPSVNFNYTTENVDIRPVEYIEEDYREAVLDSDTISDNEDNPQSVMTTPSTALELKIANFVAGHIRTQSRRESCETVKQMVGHVSTTAQPGRRSSEKPRQLVDLFQNNSSELLNDEGSITVATSSLQNNPQSSSPLRRSLGTDLQITERAENFNDNIEIIVNSSSQDPKSLEMK
ncbi:hypothetical protein G9A89_007179 [Geosiphon pyriformis]|nr:hypothetical protein G9A89_007179 [Geosiphon pyriformis]